MALSDYMAFISIIGIILLLIGCVLLTFKKIKLKTYFFTFIGGTIGMIFNIIYFDNVFGLILNTIVMVGSAVGIYFYKKGDKNGY